MFGLWKETKLDHRTLTLNTKKKVSLGIMDSVQNVISELDRQLAEISSDLNHLINEEKITKEKSSTKKKDIKEFRLFIQESCHKELCRLIDGINNKISERISASGQSSINQITYYGRLCNAILSTSKQVKKIIVDLDPASADVFNRSGLSLKTRKILERLSVPNSGDISTEFGLDSDSSLYSQLLSKLRVPYYRSHIVWVDVTTAKLAMILKRGMEEGSWSDPSRKRSWLTIKMNSSGKSLIDGEDSTSTPTSDSSGATTSDQIEYIPCVPSHYISSFFYQTCQEIQDIAGHTLDNAVVHYLSNQLSSRGLEIFQSFIESNNYENIVNDGIIQFWFDVKYFLETLSNRTVSNQIMLKLIEGRAEVSLDKTNSINTSKSELGQLSEVIDWSMKVDKLINIIKSRLDPIDVLFYENPIHQQVRDCFARTQFLYGQLTKSIGSVPERLRQSASSQSGNHNILTLVPPVARFKYLPISDPTNQSSSSSLPLSSSLSSFDSLHNNTYNNINNGNTTNSKSNMDGTKGYSLKGTLWGTLGGLWSPNANNNNNNNNEQQGGQSNSSSWFI
eukprot:TRINITY_DN1377_c0_g1_i1.p1 TRINITY_DN1377_c0_g1~~TRINITY_DN1377_c0_g1_i1.p1  ORF type:complete len:563 (+),score=116.62 TRINITY_DN1377_c0_g1_i1:1426-3114(+)